MMTIRQPQSGHPNLADNERQRCEIWTRVMGYHRPVSSFNTGKKGEFAERVYFKEPCKPC
jgi:anaerobic ribonucleoside-triphosphate reductase